MDDVMYVLAYASGCDARDCASSKLTLRVAIRATHPNSQAARGTSGPSMLSLLVVDLGWHRRRLVAVPPEIFRVEAT